MLFGCHCKYRFIHFDFVKSYRKEILSPGHFKKLIPLKKDVEDRKRASFFAPPKGSLTVEAAVALSIFFLVMAAVLQIGVVLETAVRFGSAISETGEQVAIAAYVEEYGQTSPIIRAGLSEVYAQSKVMGMAGDTKSVKNANFLLSSFLEEEDMIHLVMTYQMRSMVGGMKIPGIFFLQRGSVRGWTGRSGSGGKVGNAEEDEESRTVYVTEHGTVYHTDINCSHIHLSIRKVSKNTVGDLRNTDGEKYHTCELCGAKAGSQVYITEDGNRYHSSLECSGLKRSVHEVTLDEAGNLRPCSRCGG